MSKMAKAALGLMLATMIAKILGFGRELVLASSYGTSMYSDAYITAMNIPLVIFASIGSALGTTFIPMYYDIDGEFGEKKALKFTNNILNIIIVLCIFLAIMGLIYTEQLIKIFAVGFKGETLNIAVKFTRILIVGIVFNGLSYIITSYLQIKNNFIIPGLISIPKNFIIIISIILSIRYGPYIMVWGTLVGMASEFLFQIPFALKRGYKYKPYINIKDEYIKKTVLLLGPVFIGVAVNQINTMIDRTLASTLVEGSISALNYANKLNGFVMGLFIVSISSVIYPNLSKLSSENNKYKFVESVTQSINSVILMVIPISVGAIVLSKPIVKLLFQRGVFDDRATNMTAIALVMYSIGMIAFGLRDILGKVFYSLKDTRTPMINGVISIAMNIFLNLVLVKHLKHAGLALGTSISALICILLLFRSLKKKINYFGQDKIVKVATKSIISAIIMGIVTYLTYKLLIVTIGFNFINELIALVCSVLIGIIVYISLIYILKVEEFDLIISFFKKYKNKQVVRE